MNENTTIENTEAIKKPKNPKRVAAGKRGAEARKMKAELKRKEIEHLNKENIQLKSISQSPKQITKDDDVNDNLNVNHEVKAKTLSLKNVNPIYICLIGVVGLGLYMYKFKQEQQPVKKQAVIQQQPVQQNKSECIDPFEFN